MKKICLITIIVSSTAWANSWSNYDAFEADACNAISNLENLISVSYTNRLSCCRTGLAETNELSSAALLMLAISDDVKSDHVVDLVGDTNTLSKAAELVNIATTERNLWQKSCAVVVLSTGNTNAENARAYFSISTNLLYQWDSRSNSFNGGSLYQAIARHYGSDELTARQCCVFAAADSAKTAGMTTQFNHYLNMLPTATREFLNR